jgi:methionyl-tRNA formyltransferase
VTVRIAFLGNDPWSVPPLEALAAEPDLSIELVLTNPPRPAGRGNELRPTAVAEASRRLGLPLVETDGVRGEVGRDALTRVHVDTLVVVAYGELLPPDVLAIAPYGALNLHFSLLPRWRGASPVQHAILAGDTVTGVSVMRMDAGLDTGPVLNQLEEPIRPEDDAGSLGARLAHIGAMVLAVVVRRLPAGDLPARPQDSLRATFAPRLTAGDRTLDWTQPADALARRVRALSPEPAATTTFRDEPLKVFEAVPAVETPADRYPPGAIVDADGRGVLVRTGAGGLRLLQVAPAGRRRMRAGEWARGAHLDPGERLG